MSHADFAPTLNSAQCTAIVQAASEWLRASATNTAAQITDTDLAEAASIGVSGVFVSLKRQGRLRSCCGMLGPTIPLIRALHEASLRTSNQDTRFPPISPSELQHLELEIWILFQPRKVEANGAERLDAVTIGTHGLQVIRGESRGLLLPGVATDNGWNANEFLEQVCVKAGIHPSLWKDEETTLLTFEGKRVDGSLSDTLSGEAIQGRSFLDQEHLKAYAEFCSNNVRALLQGITPSYYFTGAPDGNVNGLVISTTLQDSSPEHVSQMAIRPDLPLQSTLFTLTQATARNLSRQGIQPHTLSSVRVDLTILSDMAMHGTQSDPDFAGFDAMSRAVLAMERRKMAWVYDPTKTAQQLADRAAELGRAAKPEHTSLFSLHTLTTAPQLEISLAAHAVRGPATRPAGVAGMFYPADPLELTRTLDEIMPTDMTPQSWRAAMVPHAGLTYSGRIAAQTLARIDLPETVIIIGPKHTAVGVECAVAPQESWALPGFEVASDPKLARQLAQAIPSLELDAIAHQREHGIEVELPLIHRLAPQSKVVGIAIGVGDLDSCSEIANGLAQLMKGLEKPPLLLISSDMNHFATDSENRRLDALALEAMETLDPDKLFEVVRTNHISMCGILPAVIVMKTLQQLGGMTSAERVDYGTSADVSGDTSRVVGYAGMLLN